MKCAYFSPEGVGNEELINEKDEKATRENGICTHKEHFVVLLGLVINVCHSSFIDLTQVCSFNVFPISSFFDFIRFYFYRLNKKKREKIHFFIHLCQSV